eukprot:TRINITY_DN1843_c0_g1_i1.p1 TRINITY_DN1843_c0_g1~~TRINITY_DN1843_c0_g1_i1.p1  ORF type:complete len:291 (-),score=87.68 TRINITY_DN1843_c0_g1_i1:19-891(-)
MADQAAPASPVGRGKTPTDPAQNTKVRGALEAQLQEKLLEIHSIQERMVQVRLDTSRQPDEIKQLLLNLVQELKRLEKDFDLVREKLDKTLEKMLDLDGLGLPAKLISRSHLNETGESLVYAGEYMDHSTALMRPLTTGDVENLKFMRTKGTEDFSTQPPAKKWKSLFGMFKEWKQQTNIAHGAYIVHRKDADERLLEHEIIKVRQAIVALRQRKDLTDAEQELFRSMQARLRTLTEQRSRSSSLSSSSSAATATEESSQQEHHSEAALLRKDEGEHKKKRDRKESTSAK